MVQRFRHWIAFLLTCLLVTGGTFAAFAATKPINNVSIKVSSDLEAGTGFPVSRWEVILLPTAGWR